MTVYQYTLGIATPGRGLINITDEISAVVSQANVSTGLCHIFLHHTSASLAICENADPEVLADAERFMQRLVPDGDPAFKHTMEGPDDMPAHIRSMLTQVSLTVPIKHQQLALGEWQGIFLWEHRLSAFGRRLTVTVID